MKRIDPIQLQRLVDGELDHRQIQQVLNDAEATPEQWQEIAVGFVENQVWSQAFRSEDLSSAPIPATSGGEHSTLTERIESEKNLPTRHRSNHSWLVLAASILVAATIGYMFNQIQNRNVPAPEFAEESSIADTPPMIASKSQNEQPVTPRITPASLQPDYHLEVPQDNEYLSDIGAGPVAPVPLYRIGSAEQLKQLNEKRRTSSLPPELLQRLNGSGYQMQQDIHFISGRLGDGRSFVVPVRTIRFLPGQ